MRLLARPATLAALPLVAALAGGCSDDDDDDLVSPQEAVDGADIPADTELDDIESITIDGEPTDAGPTDLDDVGADPDPAGPADAATADAATAEALAGTWATDCLTIDPPPGATGYVNAVTFDGDRFGFAAEYFADEGCTSPANSRAGELSSDFRLGERVTTVDGLEALELDTSYPEDVPDGDSDEPLESVTVPNLVAVEDGVLYFATSGFTTRPTGGRPERLDFDRPYRRR